MPGSDLLVHQDRPSTEATLKPSRVTSRSILPFPNSNVMHAQFESKMLLDGCHQLINRNGQSSLRNIQWAESF
ncbi:MAG: hypothetical protein H0U76_25650 [Ktedonobacteraceae bacterium]|nr:hypothetical protein [Ktedonobacteraceae bacterium]